MIESAAPLTPVNLLSLQDRLLAKARSVDARRAAETVYGGREAILRQTAMAVLAGSELPEHDNPPEATLQVLSGRVRLNGHDRSWELTPGDMLPIPPERHSVTALEDSVFLLTVRRSMAD